MSDENTPAPVAVSPEHAEFTRNLATELERDPKTAAYAAELRASLDAWGGPPVPADERTPQQQVHDQRWGIGPLTGDDVVTLETPAGYDGPAERVDMARAFVTKLGGSRSQAQALLRDLLRGGEKADPKAVAALLPQGTSYEAATAAAETAIQHSGMAGTISPGDFSAVGLGLLAGYGAHLRKWQASRPK